MAELIRPTDDTFFICPLYAFKCTAEGSDLIDLDGGIALWRIPPSLRDIVDGHIPELDLRQNKVEWVIQIPPNPKRRESPQNGRLTPVKLMSHGFRLNDDVRETMIDVVTALRLQHAGSVAPGQLVYVLSSGQEFSLGHVTIWTRLSKTGSYFAPAEGCYELLETEVDTLIEFWQEFQDKRQKGKLSDLEIALGRFNSSYGEGLEDMLIDQMIALESLYLGDLQELSYKLALRAAFLLARGRKERTQVLKRLKKAYDARSKVVHGQKPPDNLMELVEYTEEYLRQSIRHFIELSKQYQLKYLREHLLDQNIIQAGQLLKTD